MSVYGLVVPDLDRELVVVDVEGNGRRSPEIVEIATLRLTVGQVVPQDVRSWLVRPAHPITAVVTGRVHGITNADVASAPCWDEVAPAVVAELGSRALVAHSAAVERDALAAHLPQWHPEQVVDTLRAARAAWPDVPGGHGLDNLITHLGLSAPQPDDRQPGWRRHRAAYDVWMTAQLLVRLVVDAGLDLSAVGTVELPSASRRGDRPGPPEQEQLW